MNRFVLLQSDTFNPEENLRIEESVLNSSSPLIGVLRLWQNEPCVVIGKFQNEEYEVNTSYVRERGIPVIRRFTGGGTVYHDLGNLNITFCKGRDDFIFSSYFIEEGRGIAETISRALRDFVRENIEVDKRNAIFVNRKKVSGSSIAITRDRFFYHASLLVNTNLAELKRVIKWEESYPDGTGRFVKSNRSEVANLSSFSRDISIERIKESIIKKFEKEFDLRAETSSSI
ncbi:MAG: lipoate--protein ligase family protein [Caldiserica bacterium]|nr:lipoate--protein ligase family protein [Caldisericota bacterium]